MDTEENAAPDPLARTFEEILVPLVAADGGTLTFLARRGDVIEIRLAGACRGCPGQSYTSRQVILPALQSVDASVKDVKVVY
jgi:Fe-S cluster biogenesis protein NfuA